MSGHPSSRPPEGLLRSLVEGSSRVSHVEWHDAVGSTNALAAEAAAAGAPEIRIVGADVQTEGRGRQGRRWEAPPGTSLQVSFLLRPRVAATSLSLLPLLAGVVVAEVASAHLPGAAVALKWPNDLLVEERKAGGILIERLGDGAVVVGAGVNTDWRDVARPPGLEEAVSLSEVAGRTVDRWKVLAGLAGVLDRRYRAWESDPGRIVEDYRRWCATLGNRVRITGLGGREARGTAIGIAGDGSLEVETGDGIVRVPAGEVTHLRPV